MNENHPQQAQDKQALDLIDHPPQPGGSAEAPSGGSLLYRLLLATQWDEEDITLWERFEIRRSSVERCVERYLSTFDRIRSAAADPDDDDGNASSSTEGEAQHASAASAPGNRSDPARPVEKDVKLLKVICDKAVSKLLRMDEIVDEARALLRLERRNLSPITALWTLFFLLLTIAAPNKPVTRISTIWLGCGIVYLVAPPAFSALLFYRTNRLQERVRELKRRFAERTIDESNRHDLDYERCLFLRSALYSIPQGRVREL